MFWLAWMNAMIQPFMPPPRQDPRGQLRYYGHKCDHPQCLARGPRPGEAECTGHYTRPAWDRDEPDLQSVPWPEDQ